MKRPYRVPNRHVLGLSLVDPAALAAHNRGMRYLPVLALCASLYAAAEPAKPVCTAKLRGRFWPAAANSDRTAARRSFQDGSLQICTAGLWRFRWENLSVNYQELTRRHLGPAAGSRPLNRKDTGQTPPSPDPTPTGSPE